MYLYTHRLISFFEALCLLINYHIRAVLFSNSVFSHFLVVMYSESLQGSYTSTGLLTLQILLEYTMHQGQKYQLNWREQWGLQHHPRRETQDEHRIIWIFFQLAEETTCRIFSWQKSVQLHWLLIDFEPALPLQVMWSLTWQMKMVTSLHATPPKPFPAATQWHSTPKLPVALGEQWQEAPSKFFTSETQAPRPTFASRLDHGVIGVARNI